ncbi:LPXTG-motif cell wall-anchored protein/pilin isopeptide linkage protein [Alkalibaculum bacchi]|uniref:LPXTG-motif cell wall-anchored protein/pilin isopeptide linkage protein n=1 Tax=Alkalibaculum bacchi TaxID=645887 RepID=A0A366I6R6_9FIRM|nr:FctA domain-containing protein [Alkalibaculum bacchi]RBP64492.1 LPXTG-motif cell wall-anchored protein/pilin isopeptide linkage protein [Alkalibaculum bacchi]
MRRKHTKFMKVLLILATCLIVLRPTALAAEVRSGEIPVTVTLGGSPPTVDEDYKIIMKADNPVNPMPEGSVDGVFSMIITGADTARLPGIEFSSLGVYTYTISQEVGTNKLATYDSRIYNLVIYVTNAENGDDLETTVILYKSGETDKLEEVKFYNEYEEEIVDIPKNPSELPKTGTSTMTIVLILFGIALIAVGLIQLPKGRSK